MAICLLVGVTTWKWWSIHSHGLHQLGHFVVVNISTAVSVIDPEPQLITGGTSTNNKEFPELASCPELRFNFVAAKQKGNRKSSVRSWMLGQ